MPRSQPENDSAGQSPAEQYPIITSIVTVPGLDASGQSYGTILVGIGVDESLITWGACDGLNIEYHPDYQDSFPVEEGIASIEKNVVPSFVGQRLITFRHLAGALESLRETATVDAPLHQPVRQSQGVSRRAIISGFLSTGEADEKSAAAEQTTIERAIHPAIRQGVSQAMLSAVATMRRLTMVEVIADEFGLPVPLKPLALQMPIKRGQMLHLGDQVSSLAYAVSKTEAADTFGPNGERIQRFVRRLRQSLVEADLDRQMTIHVDAAGGLGQVFDRDIGKVLGALYGLEQAAAPYLIRVQDPLIMDELDSQVEALAQLRGYVRIRGMSLQLAASAGINTLDDVRTFVQAEAAHMLHLKMPRLGTIQEIVVAGQECRARGIGILLEGVPSAVTSHVALAMQPDVLTFPGDRPRDASIATLHNEMARTLAWLTQKGAINQS